jgi:flavin reductase (DIM6/NTAB) family NADH-FMN oxidoreductase RutF
VKLAYLQYSNNRDISIERRQRNCMDLIFTQHDFKSACSRFPTGVTVTTVIGRDGLPYGITVSSFASVSLSPPLVLVCIDHRSPVIGYLSVGTYFGVNVLRADQQEVSIKFSRAWHDRFAGVQWSAGQTGVPLLCDALATFECEIVQLLVGGDHLICLGRVVHVNCRNGSPLIYVNRSYLSPCES